MAVNNEFTFRGALGGLVASDEVVQQQFQSRLDNAQKAIKNSSDALDLQLSRKYKEESILSKLRKEKADAETAEHAATVAGRTVESQVRAAEAGVELTEAQAGQATSVATLNAERAKTHGATAAADIAYKGAAAGLAREQTFDVRQARATANNHNQLRYDSLLETQRANSLRNENEKATLRLRESELKIQGARAQSEGERVEIQRALSDLEARKMDLSEREEADIAALRRAQTRLQAAQAAEKMAEAGAIGAASGFGNGKGVKGEALSKIIGYDDREKVSAAVVAKLYEDWWKMDDASIAPSRAIVQREVDTSLLRYEQLVQSGQINGVAPGDLQMAIAATVTEKWPDADAVEENPPTTAETHSQQMIRQNLSQIRNKIDSVPDAQKIPLIKHYQASVVSAVQQMRAIGEEPPVNLLFEYNLLGTKGRLGGDVRTYPYSQ